MTGLYGTRIALIHWKDHRRKSCAVGIGRHLPLKRYQTLKRSRRWPGICNLKKMAAYPG